MRRFIITLLALTTLVCGTALQARAEQIHATPIVDLVSFDSSAPGAAIRRGITGLGGDNSLSGIDYRPSNGVTYVVTGRQQLFTINPLTSVATFVSTLAFPPGGGPTAIDFDPVTDRLRVITNLGDNLLVNVDTGQVTVQGSINPGGPQIEAIAYTNNFAGATSTTLYGIGLATDALYTINPATGTTTLVGGLGFDALDLAGFDISGETGIAYAVLTEATTTPPLDRAASLYTINLATGQATLVGRSPLFGFRLDGLTVVPAGSSAIPEPATIVLLGTGLAGVGGLARKRRQASKRHERGELSTAWDESADNNEADNNL